jgi:hypothetical protein
MMNIRAGRFLSHRTDYDYPLSCISQSHQNYTQYSYQNFLTPEPCKLLRGEKSRPSGCFFQQIAQLMHGHAVTHLLEKPYPTG